MRKELKKIKNIVFWAYSYLIFSKVKKPLIFATLQECGGKSTLILIYQEYRLLPYQKVIFPLTQQFPSDKSIFQRYLQQREVQE